MPGFIHGHWNTAVWNPLPAVHLPGPEASRLCSPDSTLVEEAQPPLQRPAQHPAQAWTINPSLSFLSHVKCVLAQIASSPTSNTKLCPWQPGFHSTRWSFNKSLVPSCSAKWARPIHPALPGLALCPHINTT